MTYNNSYLQTDVSGKDMYYIFYISMYLIHMKILRKTIVTQNVLYLEKHSYTNAAKIR